MENEVKEYSISWIRLKLVFLIYNIMMQFSSVFKVIWIFLHYLKILAIIKPILSHEVP